MTVGVHHEGGNAAVFIALGKRLRRDRSQSSDAISLDELAFAIRGGVRHGGRVYESILFGVVLPMRSM